MSRVALIDNVSHFETTLGVELTLYPAGLPIRAAAFVIDTVIKLSIFFILVVTFSFMDETGTGLFFVAYFVVDWFYFVIFDVTTAGRPPGKMILGLRTIQADGTPIRIGSSAIRSLLLIVDFLPLFYIAGGICISCTKKFSRLGDLAADTMVVYDNPTVPQTAHRVQKAENLGVTLEQDERLQFLAFQNRFELFSESRQIELSEKLSPLTELRGKSAVDKVLWVAEGIRRLG